jgi:hypothetical protein
MNKSRRDGVHKRILLVESDERMANPTEEKEKKETYLFLVISWKGWRMATTK